MHPFPRLYLIADAALLTPATRTKAVAAAIGAGVGLVQLRDKTSPFRQKLRFAQELRPLCAAHGVPLIINDDIGLAQEAGADGVHLGKDDAPVADARRALGGNAIIGASCYDSLELAQAACRDGADYVAFGAVFKSSTKPGAGLISLDTLRSHARQTTKPVCAIGGITAARAAVVAECGVRTIAAAAGILGHHSPEQAVAEYLKALKTKPGAANKTGN